MSILKNYLNLTEGERFREKYTFEEAIDKINSFNIEENGRRDLAQLINEFITGYKKEIEQDNDLAEALTDVIKEQCKYEFFFDWIHNGHIAYEPMASNVANLLVDEASKDKSYPDNVEYRMLNKRLFASVDGKEQMDSIKAYVDAAPSPNSRYLSYAAFSNVNFGNEYRNKLFTQTMENVPYIGAYFTNATPEMEAFCAERLKELLTGEREHDFVDTELSYIQKDCPNIVSADNLKKMMNEMSEEEKYATLNALKEHFVFIKDTIAFYSALIPAIENTEFYKHASDPLNDSPTQEEQELLSDITRMQKQLNWMIAKENERSGQLSEKDEIDEVL